MPPGTRLLTIVLCAALELGVADYDLEIARVHAALWGELAAFGRRSLGAHDQMIAFTAISHGFELATRDAAFRSVPELVLRRW